MLGKFLCGCVMPNNPDENFRDEEGFVACSTHRERRFGWRSRERRHRHECDYMTDLEYERFVLFGVQPIREYPEITGGEDRRDNRDPYSIGQQIKARLLADKESPRRKKPRPATEAADMVLAD